ncbi:MAG: winged helix-turn-helix domain-containing protein [Parabacteroides distasonis]|nr:winged helix-turn-helix domain-containing protein [Parabacteroides distasonis]MBQ4161400.1 winged helix-turn-helix domain-containing protein [Parabacteroides sp.]
MNKGTIGLNAGAICNLLLDEGCHSLEELKKATDLPEADLWSAIGWLARENKIMIRKAQSQLTFSPGMNCDF